MESDSTRTRRASTVGRRTVIAGRPPAAERRQAERRQAQQQPAQERRSGKARRKVKTQAGAQRYGVAVGEYIPESTGGAQLARGMQGQRTTVVQDLLIKAGFLGEDSGANKGRDGKFGPKTEAALKKFQQAHGLKATGVFDAATSRALNDAAPEGDPPNGKAAAKRSVPLAKGSNEGPARAPGEPKPDGTQATADAIVSARMEHYKLDPRNARPGAKRLGEDAVPLVAPGGAKIVDFNGAGSGVAIYSDGSVYDGNGWQPGKPAKRKGASPKREAKAVTLSVSELDAARRLRALVE